MLVALLCHLTVVAPTELLDRIDLGQRASELAHSLVATASETTPGGLEQPCRRLLPLQPVSWEGGRLAFNLRVDPTVPCYLTLRLWGSDVSDSLLVLFVEGRQVGYRHLGDLDILDHGASAPTWPGRFVYQTTPLPRQLTAGRSSVGCEIRSTGRIWGYGTNWEQYQKNLTEPTRGLYAVYSHVDGCFDPPADEPRGQAPPAQIRREPGPAVIAAIQERVNRDLHLQLADDRPLGQHQMQFLAKAWREPWTPAWHNPRAIERIVRSLDAFTVAWRANPRLAQSDPATWNADWFGSGPAAQVVVLLRDELATRLDQPVDGLQPAETRRAAWTAMAVACRDWHREHRRQYTNQSMINDLYGIWWPNRALQVLAPELALPWPAALRYLRESIGLEPWLGSDSATGPTRSAGAQYRQTTAVGLTKELGYVGNYGEVLDWVAEICDATRWRPDGPADPDILLQATKIGLARAVFRYPTQDADGSRVMRLETQVGWRDTAYPGNVTYAQRASWDGNPLQLAAVTRDPRVIGYTQQMLADGQLYAALADQASNPGFRTTAALLAVPGQHAALLAMPPQHTNLPLSAGRDLVLGDPENGVVAVQHRGELLYASLYWRARHAVNHLAKVHWLTPSCERVATVAVDIRFDDSGLRWQRPDYTNFGFANGGLRYPGELHSAHTGEELPIAQVPADIAYQPGAENARAGRGWCYLLAYGPWRVALNADRQRAAELVIPAGFPTARNVATGQAVPPGNLPVPPGAVLVVDLRG
ncbi:MAG: hypothetical protein IT204_19945 [Fimbriimonadaceae bacterium]|nr:hypothetical protein [Fimbriimonadaceae bacterium]